MKGQKCRTYYFIYLQIYNMKIRKQKINNKKTLINNKTQENSFNFCTSSGGTFSFFDFYLEGGKIYSN